MYNIERGIPIPPRQNRGREKGYHTNLSEALSKMVIGDSMLLPHAQANACRSLILSLKYKRIGFKITSRKASEAFTRVWRIR